MTEIAGRIDRSSGTVHSHIKAYNQAVKRSAFCPACSRMKSNYEGEKAIRS